MNFSFYIFGTPNGYNQYPDDNNSSVFQEFVQRNTNESQLTVKRNGQLVYYVYSRHFQEKSNGLLGFCLVFNGVYCRNLKKLFGLFDRTYFDVQLKGEFLKFDKVKVNYIINKFADKLLEIERIKTFFKNNLEHDFTQDFTNLSPAFKFGNSNKTISIKETDVDILAAIAEYEVVHIFNNEKSSSELDRIHKMLSELYAEKYETNVKYQKLIGEKKQYKAVIFLCIAVFGCIIGLVIFNNNLESKDDNIQSLKTELANKNLTVSSQQSEITQLQMVKSNLENAINELEEIQYNKDTLINMIAGSIHLLNYAKSNSNTEDSTSYYDIIDSNYQKLHFIIDNIKNLNPLKYEVIVSEAYYYQYCAGVFNREDCHISSGTVVEVFIQQGEYGLTMGGYIKLDELKIISNEIN
ncbi:MAG: hypothetical protein ABI851_11360 [Saprospiraceae bacterium]